MFMPGEGMLSADELLSYLPLSLLVSIDKHTANVVLESQVRKGSLCQLTFRNLLVIIA